MTTTIITYKIVVSKQTNVRINITGVNNMCKVYGYCRISTKKQSIERQERNILKDYPNAIIIKESCTGTKIYGRKEFEKLLKIIKSGDTIVFDSVSRMSRDAEEGFALYEDLYNKGVELIYNKFISVLGQNGVKVIETKDKPLDTDYHEAIAVIPAPSEKQKGKILDCVQTGYTLNDKVLRHAKVVVGE